MNCYNGEKYLKESLNSIINQTYKNWELIFFDNISTDGSKRILEQFKDQRIKYYKSEKFVNLYDARNLAIKKCSGNFVSFLDTDDSWFSDKLEKQIELYKKDPSCSLIYSNCNIYDEEKKTEKIFVKNKLPQGKITQELLNDYRVGLLTILVKRDVFKNNFFNSNYNIIGDFDFVLKLSLSTKFSGVNKSLAKYRRHSKNLSKTNFSLYVSETKDWIKKNKETYNQKGYSLYNQQILLKKLQIKKFFNYFKF
mgnify:FL=1